MNYNNLTLSDLSKEISGEIVGITNDLKYNKFSGVFTVLNSATKGDIVIRHRIDEKGIEIAKNKDVLAIICENPQIKTIETANSLNFPLIIVGKIEIANAFALKYTIDKFAPNSKKVVISGTNGKSTTSHLIYHILKHSHFNSFTNTDAKSEFNTLIDPMVSKLLVDYSKINPNPDFLVIEVSEVQGWLNKLMKDHAAIMVDAVNPDVGVVTNIAMDHIGLVNSIEEVFDETSGVAKAIKKGTLVLNYDDLLVRSLNGLSSDNIDNFFFFYGKNSKKLNNLKTSYLYYDTNKNIILYNYEEILKLEELPFKSKHFILNVLAAISACISLDMAINDIVEGVKSYTPLKRRFSILNQNPLIIDDFAHNPEGIKETIKATSKLVNNTDLWIVSAIRGSRGIEINELNSKAIAESLNSLNSNVNNVNLLISSSEDIVDNLNVVHDKEREIFLNVLSDNNISSKFYNNLHDSLFDVYTNAKVQDVVLLIGAQGMDPASELLLNIMK
ncbi:Mur ligase family protein [Methanobrevibacter filiformis]|uniref:UDP-N-acetylmuramate--L-alanine ligase n=1 Tax=Methanobrevibacter filiformis TaxID=55758 RepID=A0A166CDZ5_9EURY|nr:Mur ligase family protein [Methanobrevibacter filiformis]KZX13507.1 UDP-N-acetylmuramate--L-alanine ligase [Methanobrevibacter filiformis]